jgi:hypothetical protein
VLQVSDVTAGAALTLVIPLSLLVVVLVVMAVSRGRVVPRRSPRGPTPPDA